MVSYETVINLFGATRTATGFRVKAKLDTRYYEAGVKISDEEMKQISLRTHSANPEWNYTISPLWPPYLKVKLIVWHSLRDRG